MMLSKLVIPLVSCTLLSPLLAEESAMSVGLEPIAAGFVAPVGLVPFPGSDDLVVVDQEGAAYVIGKDGKRGEKPLIDVRSKLVALFPGFDERGLLGLAFDPRFADSSRLFVCYTAPLRKGAPSSELPEGDRLKWNNTLHVSSFLVKDRVADLASEKVLLQIDQPQFNHNSGRLLFDGNGYLVITVGDGGNGQDVGNGHVEGGNAQDIEQLLGKVLRIDVNAGDPYGIPKDNPFVGKPGRDEIFAWGVRNPWGITLNPENGSELILADVGQDRYEEVNVIANGGNYGWHIREGLEGFDPDDKRALNVDRPSVDKHGNKLVDPVLTYKNRNHPDFNGDADAKGISITGGEVYTGETMPELKGKYVFGDWSQQFTPGKGRLLAADRTGQKWVLHDLRVAGSPDGMLDSVYVTAFGKDTQGEVYVLTAGQGGFGGNRGAVHKIVPAPKS